MRNRKLRSRRAPRITESRRARKVSLTESQAIRKIARIIAEAENLGDFVDAEEINKRLVWICNDDMVSSQLVYGDHPDEMRPISKIRDAELKNILIDDGILGHLDKFPDINVPRDVAKQYVTKDRIAEFRKTLKNSIYADQEYLESEWKANHRK